MPEAWETRPLGDLANLTIGRTPSRRVPEYWTEDLTFPFCTIADMTARIVLPGREGVSQTAIDDGKARRVTAGTLLMSFKLTIGKMGFAGLDLFPNEAIVGIEPTSDAISSDYLFLYLGEQDFSRLTGKATKGSTLNSSSLARIPVSFPPAEDQQRIIDLIGCVDDFTEQAEKSRSHAQSLRSSLLSELLSGKYQIPESYNSPQDTL